ncbi:MAG: formate dehydrogenase accessory sulfurtransferase FdhD [Gammaproteobacteria bacterium]|nr:formate dehydrogenase accessory sulfurtransferase FdhD [Gammaproteobacteria bacterium]MYF57724.1 formate dehydrogenase accessory sulfurtransferase FdhD [Gammaproteobacteria bacterium]
MRASAALKSAKSVRIERFGADGGTRDDVVAMEEPLEIRLSWTHPDGRREQKSISITMRTPGNDEELAAGFLLTEGIIAGPAELEAVGPCGPPAANGLINVVRVDLARDVEVDLARLERHFYTSSSCGVCGKASLEAVAVQGRYDLHDNTLRMSAEGLGALPDRLRALQSVFERTGGLHASGLFDAAGQVRISREDVGRHNALDKLIGQALLKDELPLSDCGVVVSGRASFELMQKAMMAGIPMVAAVGAPSSLAVEFAEEFGMTLVGFLTANRFNVYSRPDRIA